MSTRDLTIGWVLGVLCFAAGAWLWWLQQQPVDAND